RLRAIVQRQSHHLSCIVDDLLDVSRITCGRITLRRRRLDLARLVREAVEDYRGSLEAGGLRLTLEAPEHPVWVMGDPDRLVQVLGNLLHNTLKFTEAGGEVTV